MLWHLLVGVEGGNGWARNLTFAVLHARTGALRTTMGHNVLRTAYLFVPLQKPPRSILPFLRDAHPWVAVRAQGWGQKTTVLTLVSCGLHLGILTRQGFRAGAYFVSRACFLLFVYQCRESFLSMPGRDIIC